jgi:hypothetical protein
MIHTQAMNSLGPRALEHRIGSGVMEMLAGELLYGVGNETFQELFILVDEIHPQYSRFVKGIKQPITTDETNFTAWQKGARKDVDRAFGNLKSRWQFAAHPILLRCIKDIAARITTCIILHKMLVSSTVMGDPTRPYEPAASVVMEEVTMKQPVDLLNFNVPQRFKTNYEVIDTTSNQKTESIKTFIVTRRDRWLSLSNTGKHSRLYSALLMIKGKGKGQQCSFAWLYITVSNHTTNIVSQLILDFDFKDSNSINTRLHSALLKIKGNDCHPTTT